MSNEASRKGRTVAEILAQKKIVENTQKRLGCLKAFRELEKV